LVANLRGHDPCPDAFNFKRPFDWEGKPTAMDHLLTRGRYAECQGHLDGSLVGAALRWRADSTRTVSAARGWSA